MQSTTDNRRPALLSEGLLQEKRLYLPEVRKSSKASSYFLSNFFASIELRTAPVPRCHGRCAGDRSSAPRDLGHTGA